MIIKIKNHCKKIIQQDFINFDFHKSNLHEICSSERVTYNQMFYATRSEDLLVWWSDYLEQSKMRTLIQCCERESEANILQVCTTTMHKYIRLGPISQKLWYLKFRVMGSNTLLTGMFMQIFEPLAQKMRSRWFAQFY